MILNNNCLPWPMSIELKTLIHHHICDRHTATVLHFKDVDSLSPVEIAIDCDGSIIMICDPEPLGLDSGSEILSQWDRGFMARYRLGLYRVQVFPLIELDEVIPH